jgi:hypothetical protein
LNRIGRLGLLPTLTEVDMGLGEAHALRVVLAVYGVMRGSVCTPEKACDSVENAVTMNMIKSWDCPRRNTFIVALLEVVIAGVEIMK